MKKYRKGEKFKLDFYYLIIFILNKIKLIFYNYIITNDYIDLIFMKIFVILMFFLWKNLPSTNEKVFQN